MCHVDPKSELCRPLPAAGLMRGLCVAPLLLSVLLLGVGVCGSQPRSPFLHSSITWFENAQVRDCIFVSAQPVSLSI